MSSKTYHFRSVTHWLAGAFLLGFGVFVTQVSAQCPTITFVESFTPNYSLVLTYSGSCPEVSWDITPASGSFASFNLTTSSTNTTYTISSSSPTVAKDIALNISISCLAGGVMSCAMCPPMHPTTCLNLTTATNSSIKMNLAGVDVMLVLDVSGSMDQAVPSGMGNTPLSKLEILKDCAKTFLESYRDFGSSNRDRIGVIYFDDNRDDFMGGALVSLSNINNMITDVQHKSSGQATCLGGGILAGYGAFNQVRANRHMLIFTDGIQNREPTVGTTPGADFMVIRNYNTMPDGNFPPPTIPPPLNLKLPSNRFRPYTIAIGDNAVKQLLQDIAAAPNDPISPADHNYNGTPYSIEDSDLLGSFHNSFTSAFVSILSTFSPQLTDIRSINVANSAATKFVVNASANKVMIKVVSDPGRLLEARIKIEKDGKDLSSLVRSGGKTYKTFFIDSTMIKRYKIKLGGVFKVTITGASGKYQVTCMINDEELEASANLGNRKYSPGDTIQLEALLTYNTLPITNATEATVRVAKPGQDVNDLFAQAGPIDIPANFPGEKGNDPGQAKYEALVALNPAFVAALQPVHDSIKLTNESNGKYTERFSDTKESGVYNFVFRFAGNDSLTGPYERFILKSTVVDFGISDHVKTVFQIISKAGLSYFQLIPKNRFDHLLGPNRLGQVHLLVNGERIKLTDNLDGSYEAPVPAFPFFTPDPKVEVDIKGDPFYSDDYSDIEGSDLPFWVKYRLWIIILFLLTLILFLFFRRRPGTP